MLLGIDFAYSGLEMNEKIQLQSCCRMWKFSHNFANFSCKIVMLHLCYQQFSKTKYESPILVCKETAKNGKWSKEETSQLNWATIKLSSDWKKIHSKKQNNFVISLFILAKVAAKWQLLALLFQKNKDDKLQICNFSRSFSHNNY